MTSVAAMPDGLRIVIGADGRVAQIWNPVSQQVLPWTTSDEAPVTSVAVTPESSRVVTGSKDGTVQIWDATGKHETGRFSVTCNFVRNLAVAKGGVRIAVECQDGMTQIWDLARAPKLSLQFPNLQSRVSSVALMPDGSRLVVATATNKGAHIINAADRDKTAQIIDAASGDGMGALKGHSGLITSIAVTPDGLRIVTGSQDRTVRIWNAESGAEIASLAVVPSWSRKNAGWADSAGEDKEAESKGEAANVKDAITSVAVTPDGTRIVAGSNDSKARIWTLFPSGQSLVEDAQRAAPPCLSQDDRVSYYLSDKLLQWCSRRQPNDSAY